MTNRLAPIIAQKRREVAALQDLLRAQPEPAMLSFLRGQAQRSALKSFRQALQGPNLAVIAEIKRKSPSKGHLAPIADPIALAQTYIAAGAAALSILTDELFFNGSLADLSSVAQACVKQPTPILRKDFVIDTIQIAQAVTAGADAILAIVAVLGSETKTILHAAKDMGVDVLVEVHTEAELMLALESGAEIIGVNNRDLTTFSIDVDRAFHLLQLIPKGIISVAESGITMPDLARDYHQAGFDAVLIGEALVTADSPELFLRGCCASLAKTSRACKPTVPADTTARDVGDKRPSKVKICGLRTVQLAEEAVAAGADLIGIVCHPASKRYVDLETAQAIAHATRAKGGIPVAVFVDHNAQEMMTFCQATGIQMVQLHGANARREHPLLPAHYQRIYVCPVDDSGVVPEDFAGLVSCDPARDYVLFDHVQAGSGKVFAWDKVLYTGSLPMGIAGGIRMYNVGEVIKKFHPALIDVSSGVEGVSGEKDGDLIRAFILKILER
ncbi:MAG: bifunctional indole-3-glycerol phosphate synthase/phosphoribosylanthranilate isomerase [Legionellales bacterium]|nr:bifunctional indole-3-glycerol phosphate synthase/phosphoribosylanthranilate isomerase [Legionellales bacterium]